MGKLYRVAITISGYADISARSDDEALAKVKNLSKSDFDWEKVDNDVLEDASIIDVFDPEECF